MSILLLRIEDKFFVILIFFIEICDFSTEAAKEWIYGFLLIFWSNSEEYSYFCQDMMIYFGKSFIEFTVQGDFVIIFVLFAFVFIAVWFINEAVRW